MMDWITQPETAAFLERIENIKKEVAHKTAKEMCKELERKFGIKCMAGYEEFKAKWTGND